MNLNFCQFILKNGHQCKNSKYWRSNLFCFQHYIDRVKHDLNNFESLMYFKQKLNNEGK